MSFINRMRAFVKDEAGQDLLEYALLTALIALAAVTVLGIASGAINGVFAGIAAAIPAA